MSGNGKRGRSSSNSHRDSSSSSHGRAAAAEAAERAAEAAEIEAERKLVALRDSAIKALADAKHKCDKLTEELEAATAERAHAEKNLALLTQKLTGDLPDMVFTKGKSARKANKSVMQAFKTGIKIGTKRRANAKPKQVGFQMDVDHALSARRTARKQHIAAVVDNKMTDAVAPRRNVKQKTDIDPSVTTVGQLKNIFIQMFIKTHPTVRDILRAQLPEDNTKTLAPVEIVEYVQKVATSLGVHAHAVHVEGVDRASVEAAVRKALKPHATSPTIAMAEGGKARPSKAKKRVHM